MGSGRLCVRLFGFVWKLGVRYKMKTAGIDALSIAKVSNRRLLKKMDRAVGLSC